LAPLAPLRRVCHAVPVLPCSARRSARSCDRVRGLALCVRGPTEWASTMPRGVIISSLLCHPADSKRKRAVTNAQKLETVRNFGKARFVFCLATQSDR
jgi:hypothetical protein